MQRFLPAIIILLSTCTVFISSAQLTRLSNNSNLEFGIQLPGIGIIVSKNDSLWRTNGTPAGTVKYATNVSVDSSVTLGLLGGKILFSGINAAAGSELWATDGTEAGTVIIKDIQPGVASSSPDDFILFNSFLFFFANTTANGKELWRTDGTEAGTVLVKDINPGAGNAFENSAGFFIHNRVLYFLANNGAQGVELWKTDGTTGGTVIVKDINPNAASSNASGFTSFGTQLIFSATNAANGTELWITDGTETGTVLVRDISPGVFGSTPLMFLPFNGKVYFIALTIPQGYELWVTDGTLLGTTMVKDIYPGNLNSSNPLLANAVIINNRFYFSATTAQGTELWYSDGTADGTQLLADINPGANSSNPYMLLDYFSGVDIESARTRLFNGKMFFQANNGTNGTELWVTDGTASGTNIVKDIAPGGASSLNIAFSYFYTASGIYFSANDGAGGNELWKSDGTSNVTQLVADINPGAGSSLPQFSMLFNGNVLFTADDGDNANAERDLYLLGPQEGTLPIFLLEFTAATLGNAVQLKWTTSSEINSSHFEIERSTNGTYFESIGSRPASYNSVQAMTYQFTDPKAFTLGVNKIFYRLKMVDKDDKFSYSDIASVSVTPDAEILSIFPNPANGQLMVTLNTSGMQEASIHIYDQNGKQYYNRQITSVRGASRHIVNVSPLSRGLYYLQLVTNSKIKSIMFMKN